MIRYFKHALLAGMIASICIAPCAIQAMQAPAAPKTYPTMFRESIEGGISKAIVELTKEVVKFSAYLVLDQARSAYNTVTEPKNRQEIQKKYAALVAKLKQLKIASYIKLQNIKNKVW